MNKLKIIVLLGIILMFTSCASVFMKDGYYSGEVPIKKDFGVVFASTTADKNIGNVLLTYVRLENVKTKKKTTLESRTCRITSKSRGMGPLAKMIINWQSDGKPLNDQIETDTKCGTLLVAEVESGKYQLKRIRIESYDNGPAETRTRLYYRPSKKIIIDIKDNETVYLGSIHTDILRMSRGYHIRSASISMNDNYIYDSKIFKQEYKILEDSLIKNSSIILEKKPWESTWFN
mgnify:CR=1 FL=1